MSVSLDELERCDLRRWSTGRLNVYLRDAALMLICAVEHIEVPDLTLIPRSSGALYTEADWQHLRARAVVQQAASSRKDWQRLYDLLRWMFAEFERRTGKKHACEFRCMVLGLSTLDIIGRLDTYHIDCGAQSAA